MAENSNIRGVHNFAIVTACSTILLLVAGALVTSNDAADSVPDWPLAYGRIIPPLIGGIRYEFAHRVVAGLVAILTVVLADLDFIQQAARLGASVGLDCFRFSCCAGTSGRRSRAAGSCGFGRNDSRHRRADIFHHARQPHDADQRLVAARSSAA